MNKPAKSTLWQLLILFAAVWVAYADTLTLDYTLDDRMIIYENDYTLQGWDGVDEVLSCDAFTGFFGEESNLVAGGRYRPLSQISFIAEYEWFGGDLKEKAGLHRDPKNEQLFADSALPVAQHTHNVLLFALLCVCVFALLRKLFPDGEKTHWYASIPFLATLLFALHPLHTEVVANIKGRDEIMAMLGGVCALLATLRYVDDRKWFWLPLSFLAMLYGVFSKESAITFLAVIPLALYFYPAHKKGTDYVLSLVPALLAAIVFLIVRQRVMASGQDGPTEQILLNNPFIGTSKGNEIATVLVTWAIYLKLMLFPHPLTHDYYPHVIEITDWGNPLVWLVVLAVGALIFYAVRKLKRKNVLSFAILYFIITFSITSNLLFNVGTFMNERFLFAPLLGFTIFVAWLFQKWSTLSSKTMPIKCCLIVICILYSGKTAVRNLAWKNDTTLFTTDVQTSENSMKCNLSAGGCYLQLAEKGGARGRNLQLAEKHLLRAVKLGRSDDETYSLLGKLYFLKKDYAKSAECYETILRSQPDNAEAQGNLDLVRKMQKINQVDELNKLIEEGKIEEALRQVQDALRRTPDSPELLNVQGRIYGEKMNRIDLAVPCLERAVALNPDFASAQENLGIAYAIQQRFDLALQHLQRAHELDPDNQSIVRNMNEVRSHAGR